jgi:hypothetical protein
MGGYHADPDIFGRCWRNADDGIADTSSTGGAQSDSFSHPPLLAGRADRSPSDLAIRLLPGQRSGSVHSQSNDARSSLWPMALTATLRGGVCAPPPKSLQPVCDCPSRARVVIGASSIGTERARSAERFRSVDRYWPRQAGLSTRSPPDGDDPPQRRNHPRQS